MITLYEEVKLINNEIKRRVIDGIIDKTKENQVLLHLKSLVEL